MEIFDIRRVANVIERALDEIDDLGVQITDELRSELKDVYIFIVNYGIKKSFFEQYGSDGSMDVYYEYLKNKGIKNED